jgi:hypothetical protein
VDEYGYYLGEAVEYELRHSGGETLKGNCSDPIEKNDLIPGNWAVILALSDRKGKGGTGRKEAPAMEEGATMLELEMKEAFGMPIEAYAGRKMRIVVKKPQADASN